MQLDAVVQIFSNNKNNPEKIFTDGKTDNGKWIDPATKLPIHTCSKSGYPYIPHIIYAFI